MCGRFNLTANPAELRELFQVELPDDELRPRYNIAPTQDVLAVRVDQQGQREAVMLRWGLVPFWAKDGNIGYRMINARAETVASKPAFRAAFRRRRCLIPATGFYEWQRRDPNQAKQPHNIVRTDGLPYAMAGLWESWQGEDGEPLESCAIITTGANDLVMQLHDRMPVILDAGEYDAWLDPGADDSEHLAKMLQPRPWPDMRAYPVGKILNNARNEDPPCIEPVQAGCPLAALVEPRSPSAPTFPSIPGWMGFTSRPNCVI